MRITPLLCLPLAFVAALGGCGESTDAPANRSVTADTVEADLGRAIDGGEFLRAGEWETETRVTEMVGMSSEDLGDMQTVTQRTCLTQADVERPDTRFFTGGDLDCSWEEFALADGRLDAAMTCATGAMPTRFAVSGTYGPDAYDLEIRNRMGVVSDAEMVTRVTARRIGDCTATDQSTTGENP